MVTDRDAARRSRRRNAAEDVWFTCYDGLIEAYDRAERARTYQAVNYGQAVKDATIALVRAARHLESLR